MATTEVFMNKKRYTDEFKIEAVKQVAERGFPVAEVAQRLGVSTHSMYAWLRDQGSHRQAGQAQQDADLLKENQRLRAQLRRLEEERDILKKAAVYFAKE